MFSSYLVDVPDLCEELLLLLLIFVKKFLFISFHLQATRVRVSFTCRHHTMQKKKGLGLKGDSHHSHSHDRLMADLKAFRDILIFILSYLFSHFSLINVFFLSLHSCNVHMFEAFLLLVRHVLNPVLASLALKLKLIHFLPHVFPPLRSCLARDSKCEGLIRRKKHRNLSLCLNLPCFSSENEDSLHFSPSDILVRYPHQHRWRRVEALVRNSRNELRIVPSFSL